MRHKIRSMGTTTERAYLICEGITHLIMNNGSHSISTSAGKLWSDFKEMLENLIPRTNAMGRKGK